MHRDDFRHTGISAVQPFVYHLDITSSLSQHFQPQLGTFEASWEIMGKSLGYDVCTLTIELWNGTVTNLISGIVFVHRPCQSV